MERLILDTGVLIGIERGALGADVVAAEDDVAISAITASELLVGVELGAGAGGPRRTFVEGILARTRGDGTRHWSHGPDDRRTRFRRPAGRFSPRRAVRLTQTR